MASWEEVGRVAVQAAQQALQAAKQAQHVCQVGTVQQSVDVHPGIS